MQRVLSVVTVRPVQNVAQVTDLPTEPATVSSNFKSKDRGVKGPFTLSVSDDVRVGGHR